MSKWTHALDDKCYQLLEPGREPVRLIDRTREICCLCGHFTKSGIWYRKDPQEMPCLGLSEAHDE